MRWLRELWLPWELFCDYRWLICGRRTPGIFLSIPCNCWKKDWILTLVMYSAFDKE